MAVNFTGKWTEIKSRTENQEKLLEAMGLAPEPRKQFAALALTVDIKHEGDNFVIKTLGPDGKMMMEETATVGIPYTPEVPKGFPPIGELIMTMEEGGKVVVAKSNQGNKAVPDSYMRMENGELVCHQEIGDVKATFYYSKE